MILHLEDILNSGYQPLANLSLQSHFQSMTGCLSWIFKQIVVPYCFLLHAFGTATEGVYLWTRSDGKLFNLSRLRARTKVQLKCIRDFLFADDAAIVAHSAENLQQLMNRFSKACQDFGLTISLKKTQVMGQGMDSTPSITIQL